MLSTDSSALARAQDSDAIGVGFVQFAKALYAFTNDPIYICSFPNDRGDPAQPGERHIITRKLSEIDAFFRQYDKPGRGTFVCVGVLQSGARKRNKANVAWTVCLHADIDFKDVHLLGADPSADALRYLSRLRLPPSIIVASGNGLHCYWLLTEPLDTQELMNRIEAVLRQLADIVAGDLAVCEVSRLMRAPDTHNTKKGTWTRVEIKEFHPERRYEFDDIEEWLSEQSPVMLRRSREFARPAGDYMAAGGDKTASESDFFAEYAKSIGFRPRVNVEQRLNAMMYMAGGEYSIHTTQLSVTASLLNDGVAIDDVVERVLIATRAAAGEYGARWNWRREEHKLRDMCETWQNKRLTNGRSKGARR